MVNKNGASTQREYVNHTRTRQTVDHKALVTRSNGKGFMLVFPIQELRAAHKRMVRLFNRFVSADAAAAGIVLFVTRKTAACSVSPYLESAYNGIACRTEGVQC
jgi:hypothetical protein